MTSYKPLIGQLLALRSSMLAHEVSLAVWIAGVHPSYRASARNFAHYLALRQRDRRPLQEKLDHIGVSSLGRAESNVLANLDKILGILQRLDGETGLPPNPDEPASIQSGRKLLEKHTCDLLGSNPVGRAVRIMVTLSPEAAVNYELVLQLASSGMDVARINCAHDTPLEWQAMAANVRRAAEAEGRPIRILMDLGGPKLRTGTIAAELPVLKLRPQRDSFGKVVRNALVRLRPIGATITGVVPHIEIDVDWLNALELAEHLDFTDASGKHRTLVVVDRNRDGVLAECAKTAYLVPGTKLKRHRKGNGKRTATVHGVSCPEGTLHLELGDHLHLTKNSTALPATQNEQRYTPVSAITCTLAEIFTQVNLGERIWFDDGRIGGVIRSVEPEYLDVEITHVRDGGEKLAGDKGINLPDSQLNLPAMTAKDNEDLSVVVRLADLVGLSFVQCADDVKLLRDRLCELGAPELGIMLKIETRRSFENLPKLLFSAMAGKAAGVMIARGDLAVECGYERLAEVQEEILWATEAAHIPVIWATQVLETLARTGLPSRAEITDAAMGERAECVMLNKGPYIREAMHTLSDILRRMQTHQDKKRPLLRALHAWMTTPGSVPDREPGAHAGDLKK
jgi:pyruvate kinase